MTKNSKIRLNMLKVLKRKGIKQNQLAERLKKCPARINQIIAMSVEPTEKEIEQICRELEEDEVILFTPTIIEQE